MYFFGVENKKERERKLNQVMLFNKDIGKVRYIYIILF